MSDWAESDLESQFNHAGANGWLPYFAQCAGQFHFPPELLLAIASRETNMRNIKGDFQGGIYHGFGIMQVDIGTDPAFCNAWTPDNVEGSIQRGTEILGGKRDSLASSGITDWKDIAAAYNAGAARIVQAVKAGLDPDKRTTGGDYGSDVVTRMAVFAKLATQNAVSASPFAAGPISAGSVSVDPVSVDPFSSGPLSIDPLP